MADIGRFHGWSGFNENAASQDSLTLHYSTEFDGALPSNPYTALARARNATGTPLPERRSLYNSPSSIMVASNFSASHDLSKPDRNLLRWDVTYEADQNGTAQYDNPLDRPPVYNVAYMDIEVPIAQAKNVEAHPHGDGTGGQRNANTLGYISNSVGEESRDPFMTTKRLEVLLIQKNYATLADIVNLNRTFKDTTNSNAIFGYTERQLRYSLTSSEGQQHENGVDYWPGTTEILAEETTDLIFNNVGFECWDPNAPVPGGGMGAVVRFKVLGDEGQPVYPPVPHNLNIDGTLGGDVSVPITYRHLEPVDYAPLLV